MTTALNRLKALGQAWRSLRDRRGNVAVISAFLMIPMSFAVGIGVDYTLAARRQDQINGFADAAALSAVTPAMMSQNASVAQAAAQSMFNAQVAQVGHVGFVPSANVTVTDTGSGATVNRLVVLNYTASSNNAFAALLGMNTITIGGASSAKSSVAPHINFYMLLDTSPSMAIAATPAGIATMVAATPAQSGCAFACHETYPAGDNLQNPSKVACTGVGYANPSFPTGGEDNYSLARCLNVALRIDNVNSATVSLMTTANTTATQNFTDYQAGIYTMDYNFNTLIGMTDITGTGGLAALQAAASNIAAVTVYDNSCLTKTNCNNDEDSYLDNGLQSLNAIMPNPGNGTSNANDTPQEVVFIVTDGVDDELLAGNRVMAPINTKASWCTTIKNRGIRIAFLYLDYYPLPTNSFYNSNIAPFQSQIATDAAACASPGLFFEVSTGGDITSAMAALFQKAVATAHLIQ